MGRTQTHTIKWRTNVDYSNIVVGQEATQYYRLTVTEKSMDYGEDTHLNSNTDSFLHVNGIVLRQTGIKNTAWKSTTIDGYSQQNHGNANFSVSLSVAKGPLSASLTLPPLSSFSNQGHIDINEVYTGYENGVNGEYFRSIKTTLNRALKLTVLNDYFEVISVLRDYGNEPITSNQRLQATWDVEIINAGTYETFSYECPHNVYIKIT